VACHRAFFYWTAKDIEFSPSERIPSRRRWLRGFQWSLDAALTLGLHPSLGIAFAWLDDAYEMISELRVSARELDLWHVAARAIRLCHRTFFLPVHGG